jgi:serine/threonine-protein kinase
MIAFTCPHCRKTFPVAEEQAGQLVRCPGCDLFAASCPDDLATVPPGPVPEEGIRPPSSSEETVTVLPSPSGTATDLFAAGDSVPGYEIVAELGRGGMGVVYKARQIGLNRPCALKMILAGGHAGEDDLARFRTEAEAIARLSHPNIVAVYEVGEHGGTPFFSLEFCSGGSLDRKMAGTPIDPREAARLVRTLALAMQAAHDANVIHRDLKPANVLLSGDGALKITDFGLAKKLDQTSQTQTGVAMGTPSYMAPEQAEGRKSVGPLADVYALGAILYECLVGRPPFKAATTFDTIMQVVTEEPVPPRRLNARVPADLETIVLKCLQKNPARRYASARELADDLGRFLAGEPIRARRVGRLERAGKWARRNPVVASLLAGVVLAVAVGCWALWERAAQQAVRRAELAERTAETERTVSLALGKAEQLRDQARQMPAATSQQAEAALAVWQQAEAALEQTDVALDTATASDRLHQRVREVREQIELGRTRHEARRAQALRKEKLLRDLDEARLARSVWIVNHFDFAGATTKYAAAFAAYGLEIKRGRTVELARRIRAEEPDVRNTLIVALDDWALTAGAARMARLAKELGEIARAVDDDAWRKKFRTAAVAGDRAALRALCAEARRLSLPLSSFDLLAMSLYGHQEHDEALALLRWARRRHPTDLMIHLALGENLAASKDQRPVMVEERIGCYRVALALRPRATAVLTNLGNALSQRKELDEAIDCYRQAIEIDPRNAVAHANLGLALKEQGKVDQAIVSCTRAIEIDPKLATAHNSLGAALKAKGKVDDAIASYITALEIDPTFAMAHSNLGYALLDKGKVDQAIACSRKALRLDPNLAGAHVHLGVALKARGQLDEAIACYRKAIEIDPSEAHAHYNLGVALHNQDKVDEAIACYRKAIKLALGDVPARVHYNLGLALATKGKVDQAIACYRKASELDPSDGAAHTNLGNALRGKGQVDEAIACYRKAIEVAPKLAMVHVNLGSILAEQGKVDEALACFRRAIAIAPRDAQVHAVLGQVLMQHGRFGEAQKALRRCLALLPASHPLRKVASQLLHQCQQLIDIENMLKAFLAGKDPPSDAADMLAMALLAQQPFSQLNHAAARLYRDAFARQPQLVAEHRYNAACCAALAAAGKGRDAAGLSSSQRLGWRRRALTWLRADLAGWTRLVREGEVGPTRLARQLGRWQNDPNLGSLRDPEALARLSPEERQACQGLWAEVAMLVRKPQGR